MQIDEFERNNAYAREAMGGHGFGNFRAENYHWCQVGTTYMHACTVHVHVHLCMLGRTWEAIGGHGFSNFLALPTMHSCMRSCTVRVCIYCFPLPPESVPVVRFSLRLETTTGDPHIWKGRPATYTVWKGRPMTHPFGKDDR